ncbi:MAG: PD-(D/E)XK nuclease family protein, partial [Candidatus Amulumruptor caecigallinarius]|nr:PD-(D/E)XK nuclease family protein [Candidatus Amulumruptor caecigallinarius]
WCEDIYLYDLIVHEVKVTKIESIRYLNSIKLNKELKYNFLLGFNSNYPVLNKDEDYLSDDNKKLLGYDTSKDINLIVKKNTINYLKNLPNLTITYSLKSFNSNFFKCSLIDELNIEVIKKSTLISKYSNGINKLNLTNYLDLYIKYGYKNDNLNLLYSIYNLNYKSYDNSFKGIDNKNLYNFLGNKLLLSYSSINNYYNCKFKYYVNDILKLNIENDKFYLVIGNLYHYILSVAFNKDFNFDYEVKKYLKDLNKSFSNKELFFINKLISSLKDVIQIINEQKKYTKLNNSLYEKQIYIDKGHDIKVTFMGVIDKLMYLKENNDIYGIIVDYKTGSPNTSLDNIKYGIDMQLPIYLYLINKEMKNIKIIGLYYQLINQKYETIEEARDKLKLVGYTIDDENLIEKIDSTYDNSLILKSMKKTNNGFSKYTKLLSQTEIEDIINLVDNKIDNAIDEILSGDFKINPKRIGDYNSCSKCIYSDICFRDEKDFVTLETRKEEDKIA